MAKRSYDGLAVTFIPIDNANIVTASTGACVIVSVQYYVKSYGGSECDTEVYEEGLQQGYSYNWNEEPPDDA